MRLVVPIVLVALAGCARKSTAECGCKLPPPRSSVAPAGPANGRNGEVSSVWLPRSESRFVAVRVVYAAGSADDPEGREGLTALTAAAMVGSGTRALSYDEWLARAFPFAAEVTADVDRDETVFEVHVPARAFESFYPLFRDALLSPRLDEESFARLRSRALTSLVDELRGSDDESLGKEALQSLIYAGGPYAHPSQGTESGLKRTTPGDVVAHRERVFCRERVTIGMAGQFTDAMRDRLSADFSAQPHCVGARKPLPTHPVSRGPSVLIVEKPSAQSTAISLGFTADLRRDSPDFPAVSFLLDYLGLHRQSSGVLYQTIREERGLNYGDYAYAEYFEQDGWSRHGRPNVNRREQLISLWLRPVKPANAPFVLRAALRAHRALVDKGVTQEELSRYRDFLSRTLSLEQQTDSRALGFAIDDLHYGLREPYDERMRRGYASLDPAALVRAAKAHLDKPFSIAIVAPDARKVRDALIASVAQKPVYDSPKGQAVRTEDESIAAFRIGVRTEDIRVTPVDDLFK